MLVVMLLKKNIYLFIIWHWVLVAAHQIFEFSCHLWDFLGFPDSSFGKESTCNAGDPGSIPGSGRSTGEGIGYPHQYSWASLVAQLVKKPPAMREIQLRSLDGEDPLAEGVATHSSILA